MSKQKNGYVMFQNAGEADFFALFLVGFTDKAGDPNSIRMFGSGFKLAVTAALRLGIDLILYLDRDKVTFKPEVVDAKILSRKGDDFKVYMRLLKKKVLTIVLNTQHDVHYIRIGDTRYYSRSHTTRIAEVENPGGRGERERPPGNDHGFLWRLDSYWRFEQRDGGTYVECEAISLSRGVPLGLGWAINPMVRALPRDSLTNTMRCTRDAFRR